MHERPSRFASMCEYVWVREREIEHVLLNVPTLCNADLSEGSMEKGNKVRHMVPIVQLFMFDVYVLVCGDLLNKPVNFCF